MLSVKLNDAITIDELLIIGTALKNAQAIINEETEKNSEEQEIDRAVAIIDRIVDEGTSNLK